ncbi:hypothetical protein MMC12_000241 [Toensbergia leucococca]|nr:hypothetical protein [Toensbergia leucococca]
MGVSTTGSSCVQGSAEGQDALYIVGGNTNSSVQNYSGLQVYDFAKKTWETCNPTVSVTMNRQMQGAAYLNSSSSILVYAGSQDNQTTPSSQTFLISTVSPWNVQAFNSDAPPVVDPLLLSYNSSHALMLGGDPQNTELYTFGPQDGWQQLDVTLPSGLPDASKAQAAIVDESDGSKILEIFNLSTSPNQVTTYLLQGADGQPASGPAPGTADSSPSSAPTQGSTRRRRQDVTQSNYPVYNSTGAPQAIRSGFSLAQDASGLVVISGGNDQVPLAVFNQTGNAWINASEFFGSQTTTPSSTISPTTSPTATATATASSSSAPATNNSNSSKDHTLTVLGATLGAVFGLAAILVILLLVLRCLRRRKQHQHKQSFSLGSKHGMDFADQGAVFMKEAGGSFGNRRHEDMDSGHLPSTRNASLAKDGSQHSKRTLFHKPGDSGGSAKSFFSIGKSPLISSPPRIVEPASTGYSGERTVGSLTPEPRTEPRTETGWSRYFTNNSSVNLDNTRPSFFRHDSKTSRTTTHTSTSRSDYTSPSRVVSSNPHESAEVPPLNLRSGHSLFTQNRHANAVPDHPHPGTAVAAPESDPDPPSPTTLISDIDEDDTYRLGDGTGPEHQGISSWTPVATSDRESTWDDRPASSVYTDNLMHPHPGERIRIPRFPRVPSTTASARNSQADDGRGLRTIAAQGFAGMGIRERELPEIGSRRVVPPAAAANTRNFPRSDVQEWQQPRSGSSAEDMSWLNLGK